MTQVSARKPVTPASWLRDQARPERGLLRAGIALGAAQAVLLCATAWLVADAITQSVMAGKGLTSLWPALVALPLIAITRFAVTLAQRRITFEVGARVGARVRNTLEAQTRQRGPQWANRQSSGEAVTRMVDGVDALVPYFARYLPQVAFATLLPLLLLLAVLPADPWSALVLFATAPLIPLFMVLAGRAAQHASQRRWTRLKRLGARFMDALGGLTTLRLLRAVEREQTVLAAIGEAYRAETMAVLRVAFLSALVLEFFATVSIAVLAVLVGFRLMWGDLGFQQGLFVLLLAPEFYLPLRALGAQRHQRMDAVSAAEDLIGLPDPPRDASGHPSGKPVLPPHDARVALRLEHVGFDYAEREILHDIDFAVAAGEHFTVVGASGCGKSTLLNLLMGFAQPGRGRILVNGKDLLTLDLAAWRKCIAWVPQRPHVFRGTLRDNLLLAAPDADAMAIGRAVDAAALGPVIARLPLGLDTPLGEHGLGLSGGECQRLALARASLRDAPLLLLDEPTQHLDDETARHVDQTLAQMTSGRSVIRIAHHLDRIPADETVLVMASGRIVESGPASRLGSSNGIFSRLLAQDRAA